MQRGFSLVELSIVLVILGLLTGGILAGQSLIRASELRSVVADENRYVAAAQTFRDKYFAVPGDFTSATKFWGRLSATTDCVTRSTPASAVTTPGACDGDGSGIIVGGNAGESQERFQFWRHLALAGLIEGTYSGISGTGGTADANRTNVPPSKLSNGLWWAYGIAGAYPGDTQNYAGDYGNFFRIAGGAAGFDPYLPIMKPEEAWNLDTKMDDGKPARGKVIASYWNNLCAAADDGSHAQNDLNASYRLSDNSQQCTLNFIQAY